MNDLNNAKKLLSKGEYTCVLCKGEKIYTSTLRGVKPLASWYEEKIDAKDFSAADKVVGKATAFLYVLLGVKKLYAGVISEGALCVLKEHGIYAEYTTLTEHIINRTGDGICPFENAVLKISQPVEAFKAITDKMKEMNIK